MSDDIARLVTLAEAAIRERYIHGEEAPWHDATTLYTRFRWRTSGP